MGGGLDYLGLGELTWRCEHLLGPRRLHNDVLRLPPRRPTGTRLTSSPRDRLYRLEISMAGVLQPISQPDAKQI